MPDVLIYGVIGEDVTAADVKADLADAGGEPITVRIDSPGGSVFQGFSIFQAIEAYQGEKRAIIESAAFSIASYIAMAFDDLEIASNGYLMVHNPSRQVVGDDDEFEREAKTLRKLKESMIKAYSNRTGLSAEQVAAMLKEETYLNAEEALASGFVTSVASASTKSRVVALVKDLPGDIFTALGCADAGTEPPSKEEDAMSDSTPAAATVAEIEKAFPQAKSDFVLDCIKNDLPMASVASQYAESVQADNVNLQTQLEQLQAENESLKAAAESAQAEVAETKEAVAKASGNEPVAQSEESQARKTAGERWNSAVAKYVDAGMNRTKAVSLANKNNPGLRQEMLSEING